MKLGFGTLPAGVSAGSTDEATVSITDDDVPSVSVSFEQGSYTVAESDDTSTTNVTENEVTIKVTLSADPERTVTVPLTKMDQGSTSNADYSGVPANVVFNSGDTEKTFSFSATQDNVDDDDESVKLGFGTLPTGVSAGSMDEATVSITDDDFPAVTVSFSAGSYSAEEGGTVEVSIALSAAPERAVTIPLTKANQGGASNSDYSGVPTSISFGANDTEKTFTFTATDDSVDDDGESVRLGFGTFPPRVSVGTNSEATVNITDGDVPSVNISFEHSSYTVAEGSSETVKVKLSADPERTVTISILRLNQNGATSADYSGVPSSVTFDSGDTEKTFSFSAASDSDNDDGESVRLSFGSMPAGVNAGTNGNATISITDDEDSVQQQVVEVQVSYEATGYTLSEGHTIEIRVSLDDDPGRLVTIPLSTTTQTGVTSADYSGVPSSLSFISGETQKSFTFTAVQDDIDEDVEELTLSFGTLPDGVSTGTNAQATVSILDSIHLSFDASYYEAHEGGNGAVVTVQLDSAPVFETVVPITATGMNGATDADWTGVPASLTFGPGETSKTFTVMAYDDTVEDGGERVELGFGTLPPGVARGVPSTATVELMNMEAQAIQYMCPSDAGNRIILESIGEFSQPGETDYWRVKLDYHRVYIIEVLGKDSGLDVTNRDTYPGDLTLEDPDITGIWDDGRTIKYHSGSGGALDGGIGRNSLTVLRGMTPSGWHEIEVQGKGGTGTYQINVRVNNVCKNVNGVEKYPYFGGPDGYVLDAAGDDTTNKSLLPTYDLTSVGGFLGDNWSWYRENEPDVDWWRVRLETNYRYTIELWTEDDFAATYQATALKILGIHDSNGNLISGTTSTSGRKVIVTFEPAADGEYYIAVGSEGSDLTGMYRIGVKGRSLDQ